jgi:primosomal protein N'
VSETASCPHCGSPALAAGQRGIDSLYQEVRRIREIAESRDADDQRRVAELTREVAELRATVARLRGSSMGGPAMGGPAMVGPAVSGG